MRPMAELGALRERGLIRLGDKTRESFG